MPIPLWMPVMTGATAAMIPMVITMIFWLRQDLKEVKDDLKEVKDDMKDLKGDLKEVKGDMKDLSRKVDRIDDGLKEIKMAVARAPVTST